MSTSAGVGEQVAFDDVPDQIYDAIFRAILDRALDPGTKLSEEVFCRHYGVSRTIVRVAVHRLQQDRLVEVQRNRGCFVIVPDRQEATAIFAARRALEPFVVRRLIDIASDDDLTALRIPVDKEDAAYLQSDRREALRLAGQFHLLLAKLADSVVIEGFLKNLICRSALVIATYSDVRETCKAHEHRDILRLIEARKPDEAVANMLHHLEHIERDLLQEEEAGERPSLQSVLEHYGQPSVRPKANASIAEK